MSEREPDVENCYWIQCSVALSPSYPMQSIRRTGIEIMSSYVFSNEGERGTHRLTALEKICDPITRRHLDTIGIMPGWRCLEIGAGSGSIAAYMADRVGRQGSVLATDIDTRFLEGLDQSASGNIEVRRHDITRDLLPEQIFDIVHARHVFVHLRGATECLARLTLAVKPGGWLFIEDFDPVVDRAIPITDQEAAQAFRSAVNCPWVAFRQRGNEQDWGRRLANTFQNLGLTDIEVQAHLQMVRGGSPFAEFYKLSLGGCAARASRQVGRKMRISPTRLRCLISQSSCVFRPQFSVPLAESRHRR
jgi:2-polyprenyl-3-methyl-5-hydroxy-6-metoxy-1,4-benzoquinol methylase